MGSNNNISQSLSPAQYTNLSKQTLLTVLDNQGIDPTHPGDTLAHITHFDAHALLNLRAVDQELRNATDSALNRTYHIQPTNALAQLDADVQTLKQYRETQTEREQNRVEDEFVEIVGQRHWQTLDNVLEHAYEQGQWTPQTAVKDAVAQWDDWTKADYADRPDASPYILALLAKAGNSYLREVIAKHQNTLPETLTLLARREDVRVQSAVAANPKTPERTYRKLATHYLYPVRAAAALNEKAPRDVLANLSRDIHNRVRAHAAANTRTPSDDLARLSRDPNESVRAYAGMNPNTPRECLDEMIEKGDVDWMLHPGEEVGADDDTVIFRLCSLALNPKISPEQLRKLALSPNIVWTNFVASHPDTPQDALQEILNQTAQADIDPFQLLDLETQLIALITHQNITTEMLDQILTTADAMFENNQTDRIDEALAKQPKTSPACLRKLSNKTDSRVLLAVKENPNTPPACRNRLPSRATLATRILQQGPQLFDEWDGFSVPKDLLANTPEILTALEQPQCEALRIDLATDPTTPDSLLRWLITSEDEEQADVKVAVAKRPNLSTDIRDLLINMITEQLAADEDDVMDDEMTELATALAPKTDIPLQNLLDWAGYDNDLDTALAQNPTLQKLAARERHPATRDATTPRTVQDDWADLRASKRQRIS